jgi:DNA-binding transcriptional ArsR family regulator
MQQGGVAGADGGSARTDGGVGPDRETVFDILSNRRRRYVLHFLRDREGPTDLRELSERIAAWENDRVPERVTSKERKRVYAALHQSHLPKMDRAGIVSYDPDRGTIELTDAAAALDVYLEVVPRSDLDWGGFYIGLGALGTLVATLVALEVFPFRLVPPVAYLYLFALVAILVGAVRAYSRRRARVEGGVPPDVDAGGSPDPDSD